jgi:hypothetical protein
VAKELEQGDSPSVVAEAVLTAALAPRPKLRYMAGGSAKLLGRLRRFAPTYLVDAGIRKNLQLDAPRPAPAPTSMLSAVSRAAGS